MSDNFGTIIESLVAVLLVLTIGYCWRLNQRLKRLKADEQSLRATISELVTATEIAERAIGGLKLTVDDCERGLAHQLVAAERFTAELEGGIAAGKDLLGRLPQRAGAARRVEPVEELRSDPQAVAAAAQAFAERLRLKVHGLAA